MFNFRFYTAQCPNNPTVLRFIVKMSAIKKNCTVFLPIIRQILLHISVSFHTNILRSDNYVQVSIVSSQWIRTFVSFKL